MAQTEGPGRPQAVVDFAIATNVLSNPSVPQVLDVLRKTLGKVTSYSDVVLFLETAGTTVAAGTNTVLEGSQRALNAHDGLLQQIRLVVRGTTNGGSQVIELLDLTSGTQLCTATITNSLTTVIGTWSPVIDWNADHIVEVRSVGDGSHTQTLYAVTMQARTHHVT